MVQPHCPVGLSSQTSTRQKAQHTESADVASTAHKRTAGVVTQPAKHRWCRVTDQATSLPLPCLGLGACRCSLTALALKAAQVDGLAATGVQGLEQTMAQTRLGLRLAFNPRRCSLHFQLNCANPEHAEVARKLVDIAQKVS